MQKEKQRNLYYLLASFLLSAICIIILFSLLRYMYSSDKKTVLSVQTKITAAPTKPNNPTPEPSITPTSKPSKNTYTIAVFGDSMVDTMGELLEYLEHSLKREYPDTIFKLYNYGMPIQNVEDGLERFHTDFSFKTRKYPPITQINADIIILGSFAYNPFPPHNRDRHWTSFTKLVNEAKKTSAKVYILAEVAPLGEDFGKGPNGPNWPQEQSINQANNIIELLENVISLSKALNVPLIDTFSKSQVNGRFGSKIYVDANDGIHPSIKGHEFISETIVDTIILD